jgi:hypothetical protein
MSSSAIKQILYRFGITLPILLKDIIIFKLKTITRKSDKTERSSFSDYRQTNGQLEVKLFGYKELCNYVRKSDDLEKNRQSSNETLVSFESSCRYITELVYGKNKKAVVFEESAIGFSVYDNKLQCVAIGVLYFFDNKEDKLRYFFITNTDRKTRKQRVFSLLDTRYIVVAPPRIRTSTIAKPIPPPPVVVAPLIVPVVTEETRREIERKRLKLNDVFFHCEQVTRKEMFCGDLNYVGDLFELLLYE